MWNLQVVTGSAGCQLRRPLRSDLSYSYFDSLDMAEDIYHSPLKGLFFPFSFAFQDLSGF